MNDARRKLIPFTVMSVVMFVSLFFSMKIAGIGLLLWVLTFVWTLSKTMFVNLKPSDLVEANNTIIDESIESGKYVQSSVHLIAMPMVIIGLLWVIITVFMMIFIL